MGIRRLSYFPLTCSRMHLRVEILLIDIAYHIQVNNQIDSRHLGVGFKVIIAHLCPGILHFSVFTGKTMYSLQYTRGKYVWEDAYLHYKRIYMFFDLCGKAESSLFA